MAPANNVITKLRKPQAIDRQQLGDRLRKTREYLGLSQEEVAKRIGIPRSALSNIESGQRGIDALELRKIAELYKLPLAHFTGETSAKAGLPDDVAHLARKVASLSKSDRAELERFAEYLSARKAGK
ncbi:MAG: helix-turn-helix domain-containing protein [Nitrospiraceae bacterium]